MAWAKFDDRWATHPKLLAAGLEAKGLDASGICYAAGQETDGFVPDTALIILAAGHRHVDRVAQRLVDVGRWIRDEERKGYVIHDFDVYNFTRAQGEAKRAKAAERKAAYRAKQGRDAQGRITSGDQDADVRADTDDGPEGQEGMSPWDNGLCPEGTIEGVPPVPTRPDPTRTTKHRSSSSLELVGERPAEEEDHSRESWDGLLAARLIAKRRCSKLSNPPPEGFRRDRWLATTVENLLATDAELIREHLTGGMPVEAVVDLFEPPERPTPAGPTPSRDQLPPAWDLDDNGLAVPRSVGA